jgi:ribosomal protein S18 acetylase RimI-like enzyme
MQLTDITAAARLHCLAFPDSRSTKLGKPYVRKMFRWFVMHQPGLSLVARSDGEISGYVVGAVGGYGRKLFRYAFFEVLLGLLIHPGLWFQSETFLLWRSYLKGLFPQKTSNTPQIGDEPVVVRAALAGIGVDPGQQGQGVGSLLVAAFEEAAVELGVGKLTLSVDKDNVSARRLYDRHGWLVDDENKEANTVHYTKVIA